MAVTTLTVKPFDGTNFSNWEFRIKLLLEHHGVDKALEQDPPTETTGLEAFLKIDLKARNLLVQCLADNVLEIVKTKKTAKEMITELRGTYQSIGLAKQVQLQKKLRNMKFSGGPLNSFLVEYDKTVAELKSCGGKMEDSEIITQLLSAMPESYQTVTTAIDILFCQENTMVKLDFVKNKLLMEEARQTKNEEEKPGPNHAFSSKGFQKWKNKKETSSDSSSTYEFPYRCHLCGRKGHKRIDCPENRKKYGKKYSGKCNITENKEDEIAFVASEAMTTSCDKGGGISFVVDSGATQHLMNKNFQKYLTDLKTVDYKISVAKVGESVTAKKQGTLHARTLEGKDIRIENVLVCENLSYNLLSVKQLEQKGQRILFHGGTVKILRNDNIVAEGKTQGNLYFISLKLRENIHANLVENDDKMLLHRRMGHSATYPAPSLCEVCIKAKQTRLPFTDLREDRKAKHLLETVSTDICGPITPTTFDGYRYFITFIDSYSHFCVCYLLKQKSEAIEKFKNYIAMVEAKFNTKIEKLRCDNGGEYSSQAFLKLCKEKGIIIQYTVAYNPEQNGIAERYNRTIMEKSRCLIYDSALNKNLWGEAVRASVYLINRMETRTLENGKTPAEVWYSQKPNLAKIKLFGCPAYNFVPKEMRKSKLDPHCKKLRMIGYADNGYRLWDEEENKVIHARNVIFKENKPEIQEVIIQNDEPNQKSKENKKEDESKIEETSSNETQQKYEKEDSEKGNNENQNQYLRRSTRPKHLPKHLQDFNIEHDLENSSDIDSDTNLFAALSAGNILSEIPQTYTEAIKMDNDWKLAVEEELQSLEESETWELVVPPNNVEIIDSKWVFREKEVSGCVKKKARLVARGFKQYSLTEDVYSPVARMATIRVLLSFYVEQNLYVQQLDVRSAFLNGTLKTPVYMKQPEGYVSNDKNLVCKLKKALYGLKQAPKCWNSLFNESLLNLGFQRSKKDSCLYFTDDTFLLIHVDDLIILSQNVNKLNFVKTNLSRSFKMNEFKNDNIIFLGLEITKINNTLYISQKTLIRKILTKFNMENCKPSSVPMQPKLQLSNANTDCDSNLPYKELIGCLMYVMLGSRPDLSFCITYFSQFQKCYTIEHWNYLKSVLKYLKQTENYGLKFVKGDNSKVQQTLYAYADSDFASNSNDRKSISGYLIKLNKNIICWKTKKQSTVALSSAESEYIALSACICECLFLGQMLSEILDSSVFPVYAYEDNQSCIRMASTLESKRTKHIDVKHYFIRDCLEQGFVILNYVSTENQQADILTKALAVSKFKYLRDCLNVVDALCQ